MSDIPTPPQNPTRAVDQNTPPGPSPAIPDSSQSLSADVEKNKVLALLSYIGLLWLVPLLVAKDSPYAKFHCNQGILLSIAWIVVFTLVVMVSFVVVWIPILGACMIIVLYAVSVLSMMAFMLMGIINALSGKMKPLPLFPVVSWVK